MRHSNIMNAIQDEALLSEFVDITHVNSPLIFETKQGALGSTLCVEGVPFVTTQTSALNHYQHQLHQAMMGLNEQLSVTITLVRARMESKLSGEFKEGFTKSLNSAYHKQFQQKNMYANTLYITVLARGIQSKKGIVQHLFSSVSTNLIKGSRALHREKQSALLNGGPVEEMTKTYISDF